MSTPEPPRLPPWQQKFMAQLLEANSRLRRSIGRLFNQMAWLLATPYGRHQYTHHRREQPIRSALHAQYRHRQVARRRRNRR